MICCHSNSCEKPSTNTVLKSSKGVINNDNDNNNNNYFLDEPTFMQQLR